MQAARHVDRYSARLCCNNWAGQRRVGAACQVWKHVLPARDRDSTRVRGPSAQCPSSRMSSIAVLPRPARAWRSYGEHHPVPARHDTTRNALAVLRRSFTALRQRGGRSVCALPMTCPGADSFRATYGNASLTQARGAAKVCLLARTSRACPCAPLRRSRSVVLKQLSSAGISRYNHGSSPTQRRRVGSCALLRRSAQHRRCWEPRLWCGSRFPGHHSPPCVA